MHHTTLKCLPLAALFLTPPTWGQDFATQRVITNQANGATAVYAKDLDGDGDADVLSASFNDDKIAWYENLGSGVFGAEQIITTMADGAKSVFAVDLDGDGDADVLSASGNSGDLIDDEVAWHENLGSGTFGPRQVLSSWSSNGASCVFAIDLDGDSDVDVLSARGFGFTWHENLGSGAFGPEQMIASGFGSGIFAKDLDGDGDADVLTASIDDKITWHENLGSGAFGPGQVLSTTADGATSVHAADLDGDGDADVLSTSQHDDKVAWYENLGSGNFGPEQTLTTTADGAKSVYAADLDRDGDLDVLSASYSDNQVGWHENLGAGTFGPRQLIPMSAKPTSVYAEDLDGDGDADVLGAFSWNDRISWSENLMGECRTTSYCSAVNNSNGTAAQISAASSPQLSAGTFTLQVAGAMPSQFGMFFYGAQQQALTYGVGTLCVAQPFYRLVPVVQANSAGDVTYTLDFNSPPASSGPSTINPFSTWNFQFWYRDPNDGVAGFNFSNGLEVTFCP